MTEEYVYIDRFYIRNGQKVWDRCGTHTCDDKMQIVKVSKEDRATRLAEEKIRLKKLFEKYR